MDDRSRDLSAIAGLFQVPGRFVSAEPYGSGHINETYRAVYKTPSGPKRLIHQLINTNVFRDPEGMMDNILRVTRHIAGKVEGRRSNGEGTVGQRNRPRDGSEDRGSALDHRPSSFDPSGTRQRPLVVVTARDGRPFAYDRRGNFWRTFECIEGAVTYDRVGSPAQAYVSGQAFGRFQAQLVDLPGPRLNDTIPNFHHGGLRLEAFKRALEEDRCGRAGKARPEIEFVLARESLLTELLKLKESGALPERITHNDTKFNNLLLDADGGEAVCVVDLDTVMPGLVAYDFGDMVRTCTSPTEEDEQDLSRVGLRPALYRALLQGYLSSAGSFLTPLERETLCLGGKFMTMVIGVRFLTDYLSGDTYFRIHRDGQNLDRCRTQFKLVATIEQHEHELMAMAR